MADGSLIQWLQRPDTKPATLNPIRARNTYTQKRGWYCEHVSEACRNCYAEALNVKPGTSGGTGLEYKPGWLYRNDIYLDEQTLRQPIKWSKPRTIFWCSMTDALGAWVKVEWLARMFAVFAITPQHVHIVLTKRADRLALLNSESFQALVGEELLRLGAPAPGEVSGHHFTSVCPRGRIGEGIVGVSQWPLPSVWVGVTAEDQKNADERIPHLLQAPAAVRFVSLEPMLGPIDLDCPTVDWMKYPEGNGISGGRLHIDWVISGGESGKNARPMHPEWARSLRDQCKAAGTPFFFKQWGEWKSVSQMSEPEIDSCYRSNRIAKPGQDQIDIDDVRGRRCLVDTTVLHHDGSQHHLNDGNAFQANVAAMTMFRIGKSASGRLLDGHVHNEFPKVSSPTNPVGDDADQYRRPTS